MALVRVGDAGTFPIGEPRRVEVEGLALCVVRTGEGEVKALHDVCSHQEYALSEGWVDDNEIECPEHGSMFDLDTGAPGSLPATKPVPVYAARIDDGAVWVDPARQLNEAPVPRH